MIPGIEAIERAARIREDQQMYDELQRRIPPNLAHGRVAGIVGRTQINHLADPHRGTPGRDPINHFHDVADVDAPTPEITTCTFVTACSGSGVAVVRPDSQPQTLYPQP